MRIRALSIIVLPPRLRQPIKRNAVYSSPLHRVVRACFASDARASRVSWRTVAARPERQPGTRSSRRLLSVKWSTLPSLAGVVGRGGRAPPQLDLDARSP